MADGAANPEGQRSRRYRITVVGEWTQPFVAPLDNVAVVSAGDESILICDVADQAKLQGILSWLYGRGIEIVSVVPVVDA